MSEMALIGVSNRKGDTGNGKPGNQELFALSDSH
jgi:hypothetical protein